MTVSYPEFISHLLQSMQTTWVREYGKLPIEVMQCNWYPQAFINGPTEDKGLVANNIHL